jgi:uncharacterized membrane protein
MAKDLGDAIGTALGHAAREVVETVSTNALNARKAPKNGALSGGRGLAAGAGLAALVPLAAKGAKGATRLVRNVGDGGGPIKTAGDKISSGVQDAVGKSVDAAGGAGGLAKEAGKAMLPGGGGGKKSGVPGVGKGRRMPVQQSVDIGAPLQVVYNEWTQFEDWPTFMHRLERVAQEDETHLSFKVKIWGISREFKAEILEQRPDERIKWRVTEGVSHTGVVTFHELAPRLTRVEVNIDVHPGSIIEKLGRGMRHVKRAVRADLHRFKAYVVMEEDASGEWRGEIEDGEVKSQSSSRRSSSASSSGSSSRSSSGRSRSSSGGGSGRSSGSSSSGGSGRSSGSSSSGGSGRSSGSSGSGSRRRTSSNGASAASRGSSSRSRSSRSASSSNGSGSSRSGSGSCRSGSGSSRSGSSSSGSGSSRSGSGSRSGSSS